MSKSNLSFTGFVLIIFSSLVYISCGEETIAAKTIQPASLSYREEFDSMQKVIDAGWKAVNLSNPIGATSWQGGNFTVINGKFGPEASGFPANSFRASPNEYAWVNFTCGAGLSFINCWLISPALSMKNGDVISFWTRTREVVSYPDRMQVWLNPTNDGTNVGRNQNETGDFTVLMKGIAEGSTVVQSMDLNPTLTFSAFNKNNFAGSGFPTEWTRFVMTITGLPNGTIAQKHRVAFRYYVKDGGPGGLVSDEIGIDDFDFTSN